MRAAVVTFPGSNCDRDLAVAMEATFGAPVRRVWHQEAELPPLDVIGVPGGFAFGDYLRCGAIAACSPVMREVIRQAERGACVLGVCNGFQVLTEAGLLPGALQKNRGLSFLCTTVGVRVESTDSALTSEATSGAVLRIPINHFEGNYTCSPETLAQLRSDDRIVFRYVENPNGSTDDIAGVCSAGRNVVGLMPHPERASHELLGSTDGRRLLQSLLAAAGDAATSSAISRPG